MKRVGEGPGYAHAVIASGKLAFVSGQVALDEKGDLVGEGDVRDQTVQAMRNLEGILHKLGATWADVVKFGWYLTDVTQIQAVRDVRDEFLDDVPKPASTLVEVKGLFRPDLLVEVDAVVALPDA